MIDLFEIRYDKKLQAFCSLLPEHVHTTSQFADIVSLQATVPVIEAIFCGLFTRGKKISSGNCQRFLLRPLIMLLKLIEGLILVIRTRR